MDRFYKRKLSDDFGPGPGLGQNECKPSDTNTNQHMEINLGDLPIDPAKRKSIYSFDANDREKIRRFYLQKGPCQPNMEYPWRLCGNVKRRLIFGWFKEFPSWLEYSISEDSAYCLYCYLFKPMRGCQSGGDAFVSEGFTNYRQSHQKFREHVGNHNSIHNKCVKAGHDLLNQNQHIETCISNQTAQDRSEYRNRLVATIDVIRICLNQGLAFRGHDESSESTNQGNFLSLLEKQANEVLESICCGELLTGRGLNQESTLKRPGDTRWGSHYSTLLSFIRLFSPIIDVLEDIEEHTKDKDLRGNAGMMLTSMQHLDFIFFLHLMTNILGISNELSRALQRKDQDIVNAMKLVKGTKSLLLKMRNDGWESLINEVTLFCEKHDIVVFDYFLFFDEVKFWLPLT